MVDQEEFLKVAQKAMNAMFASYKQLDRLKALSLELEEERKKFEEKEGRCDCVSLAYHDLADLTEALRHVLKLYGKRLDHLTSKVVGHDGTMSQIVGMVTTLQGMSLEKHGSSVEQQNVPVDHSEDN